MLSAKRIKAILFKEFKQLQRDRITFAMIAVIPLIQLTLFGYAINTDVRHVPSGVVDYSQTSYSRQFIQDLEASEVVLFKHHYASAREAEYAISRGEVNAVLIIPDDFIRRIADKTLQLSQRSVAQWITDSSDPLLSGAVNALQAMPISLRHNTASIQNANTFTFVNYYNPERKTAINIVPGLVAVILTMTMIMFTSAAIVREREHGNMEFLINTPVRPIELMLGKIIPYVAVGFFQMFVILGLGNLMFGVPFSKDIFSLCIITFSFVLASLSLGLLISTRAQTQLQAMQMTVFILLPSILLSGFMFPYDAMPTPAQWIAEVLPATHYVRMMRAVVLRETPWYLLQPDLVALWIFSGVGLVAATMRFKKRLD